VRREKCRLPKRRKRGRKERVSFIVVGKEHEYAVDLSQEGRGEMSYSKKNWKKFFHPFEGDSSRGREFTSSPSATKKRKTLLTILRKAFSTSSEEKTPRGGRELSSSRIYKGGPSYSHQGRGILSLQEEYILEGESLAIEKTPHQLRVGGAFLS